MSAPKADAQEDAYAASGAAIRQLSLDTLLTADWAVRGFPLGTDSLWRMALAEESVCAG